MEREALETIEHGKFTGKLYQDEDPNDPREDDNIGTMVCFHRNYKLGDKHKFNSPEHFDEWHAERVAGKETPCERFLMLPLYLYDHSGISMRTYPHGQHVDWDCGMVGYIYITYSQIRKEYSAKRVGKALLARVTKYLENEVETYNQYLTGDVYGIVVTSDDGEEVENCWGFYGWKYAQEEAKRQVVSAFNYARAKASALARKVNRFERYDQAGAGC